MTIRISDVFDLDAHLKEMLEIDQSNEREVSDIESRYNFLSSIPEYMSALRRHGEDNMAADLAKAKRRHEVARHAAEQRMAATWHLHRAACDVALVTHINVDAILRPRKTKTKRPRASSRVATARKLTVWIARQTSSCSYPILAHTFGMNHTTLVKFYQQVDGQVQSKSGIFWDILLDLFLEHLDGAA